MRLINWNIDSLKAALAGTSHRGHESQQVLFKIAKQRYDIVGLQEIKLPPTGLTPKQHDLLLDLFPGYDLAMRPAQPPARKSYGGELFLFHSTLRPRVIKPQLDVPTPLNDQGRLLALVIPEFILLQVYSPNAGQHLKRAALHHEWNQQLINYVKELRKDKPIIVVGDFSMVYSSVDVADPANSRGQTGFTESDVKDFQQLLQLGLVDAFRMLHPGSKDTYTWWPQIIRSSKRNNYGWRADYWLVDQRLKDRIQSTGVVDTGERRDHAPITLQLTD